MFPVYLYNNKGIVFGGSYYSVPNSDASFDEYICLEDSLSLEVNEIGFHKQHNWAIPDFGIPDVDVTVDRLKRFFREVYEGDFFKVYVGCTGGIGRTGTILAIMLEISRRLEEPNDIFTRAWSWLMRRIGRGPSDVDPVEELRKVYKSPNGDRPIETNAQEEFVRNFPYDDVVNYVRKQVSI